MKILENFRTRIALRRIAKTESRRKIVVGISRPLTAQSIALLAAPTDEVAYGYLMERIGQWQSGNKRIKAIFWHDFRQLPPWVITDNPDVMNLCRKNSSFFFEPDPEIVEPFVRQPFELLLNIALPNCMPLLYIVAQSAATFRAGFSDGKLFLHDFTLLPGEAPEATQNLETLIHQLNQINP